MVKTEVLLSKGYFQGVETVFQRLSNPEELNNVKGTLNDVRKEYFPNIHSYKWMPNIEAFNRRKVVKITVKGENKRIQVIRSFQGPRKFNTQIDSQLQKLKT